MLRRAQIELRVTRLLGQYNITSPPIDVEKLAESLGAEVRREPYEGEISGALFRREDKRIIGVNESDGLPRQRFTIAHEIAHLVLHDTPAGEGSLHIDWKYPPELQKPPGGRAERVFRRSDVSKQAVDPDEIEANRFAAALLMPLEFLTSDVKSLKLPVHEDDLDLLVARYDVSQKAMFYRLMNLGIPVEAV